MIPELGFQQDRSQVGLRPVVSMFSNHLEEYFQFLSGFSVDNAQIVYNKSQVSR